MFVVFQAEDGIRDLVRSRGLGDVYKRQAVDARRRPAQLAGQQAIGAHRHLVGQQVARVFAPVVVLDGRRHQPQHVLIELSLIHI